MAGCKHASSGRSANGAQCFREPTRRRVRVSFHHPSGLLNQRLKQLPVGIDLIGIEHIPGTLGHDRFLAQQAPEASDIGLKRAPGGLGRVITPDFVDQTVGRNDPSGVDQQHSQHRALSTTPKRYRSPLVGRLERT